MTPEEHREQLIRRLVECGGVGPLRASGSAQRRALIHAIEDGLIVRLRPGWFALPDADPALVAAVRRHGALTGPSALALLNRELPPKRRIWLLADDRLHIAVARSDAQAPMNLSRTRRAARVAVRPGRGTARVTDGPGAAVAIATGGRGIMRPVGDARVCVHPVRSIRGRAVVPFDEALAAMARCQPAEATLAAWDSALNRGLIRIDRLRELAARTRRRPRSLVDWCDAASQSGTETIMRFRLARRRIAVRSQVWIDGVGFVDLLVGDRLVIECDSREFHDTPDGYAKDRARDQVLLARGYLVLRLSYADVVHDGDRIDELVLGLVRADRHRWPRRGRAS